MSGAIAEFKRMPATKDERKNFVQIAVNEILSGSQNPLEVELMLKSMEMTIEEIRKNKGVKEAVMEEAEKYNEKTFDFMGASITIQNRSTYDYSNDGTWCGLKEEETQIANRRKARELILKGTMEPLVDEDTGEVTNPPFRTSQQILVIQFK